MLRRNDIAARCCVTTRTLQRWIRQAGRPLTARELERRANTARRRKTPGRRIRTDDRPEQLRRLATLVDAMRSGDIKTICDMWTLQREKTSDPIRLLAVFNTSLRPHRLVDHVPEPKIQTLDAVRVAAAPLPTRWLPYFIARLLREALPLMPFANALYRPRRSSKTIRQDRMHADEATPQEIKEHADMLNLDVYQWAKLRFEATDFQEFQGTTATPRMSRSELAAMQITAALKRGTISENVAKERLAKLQNSVDRADPTSPRDENKNRERPSEFTLPARSESSRPVCLSHFVSDSPGLARYYSRRTQAAFEQFMKKIPQRSDPDTLDQSSNDGHTDQSFFQDYDPLNERDLPEPTEERTMGKPRNTVHHDKGTI